jgi:hypothetical protein
VVVVAVIAGVIATIVKKRRSRSQFQSWY